MGTPKKEDVRQKELKSPTIAEKIRLFEIGKKTGRSVMLEKLPDILEEVKEIILPLVPLLDKQIFSGNEFLGCFVPERFREKRGMCFFSPRSMIIWLERSGKWFVWLYVPKPAGNFFQEADSQQLAVILLQESEGIRKESLRGFGFLEELIFFKDAALYHALIPYVLSCFSERVAAVLKEKEEKLRIMKERLGLLNDFTQSLDPLTNRSERITIKEYSIYRDHKHGTSNEVSGYLCAEALEPF